MAHDWPGNVRQLANVLERASIYAESPVLDASDVTRALSGQRPAKRPAAHGATAPPPPASPLDGGPVDLRDALRDYERTLIAEALRRTGGKQTEAAALLGLSPKNLWAKIKKHGMDPKAPS